MKVSILCLVLVFTFFSGFTQSRSELEKQRTKMLQEISETEQILSDVKKNKIESVEELDLLDKKITTRNNLIGNISKDISKVDVSIKDLELQIDKLNSNVVYLKKEYARVIWLSYLNRQKLNQLLYILSAADFNQAYRRLIYIRQYSEYRKRQIKAIQGVQVDLGKKLVELDLQKSEKSKLLIRAEKENKSLSFEMEEKSKLLNSLKSKEKTLTAKIKENSKTADRLKKEIERLIRKEIEANNARIAAANAAKAAKAAKNGKNNTTTATNIKSNDKPANVVNNLTPEDAVLSSSFKENRGKLPWPTERGMITGFFGERSHPVYKYKIQNNGIDITTVEGSLVRCLFDGKVIAVIPILGANFSVLLRHGNYFTLYSNMIDVNVKAGDMVKTKQIIGKVFTDRYSNATILHLEVYENLKRLDPQLWLNKN